MGACVYVHTLNVNISNGGKFAERKEEINGQIEKYFPTCKSFFLCCSDLVTGIYLVSFYYTFDGFRLGIRFDFHHDQPLFLLRSWGNASLGYGWTFNMDEDIGIWMPDTNRTCNLPLRQNNMEDEKLK